MNPPQFLVYNNCIPFPLNHQVYFTILPSSCNSTPYNFSMTPMEPSIFENQIQPFINSKEKNEEFIPKMRIERSRKKSGKILLKQERKTSDPDEYRTKEQNSQRNIMSNIAHHLMSFLKKSLKIRPILQKIIEKHNLEITCEDFFQFISKIELKNYIRLLVLKEKWSLKYQDQRLAKAFRIMSYYFFTQKYFPWIQSSKKIKTSIKIQHMSKRRSLLNILKSGN